MVHIDDIGTGSDKCFHWYHQPSQLLNINPNPHTIFTCWHTNDKNTCAHTTYSHMKKEKCCHLLIIQKHFISERTVLPDKQLHKLNIFSSLLFFQVSLSDPFIRVFKASQLVWGCSIGWESRFRHSGHCRGTDIKPILRWCFFFFFY